MRSGQSGEKIDPASVIRAIWNSNRDEVLGRVVAIEEAVAAVIEKRLTPEGRETAERDAHKLAGAAGTFGFGRASEAARRIERILSGTDSISLDLALIAADEVVALRSDLSRDPSPVVEPEPEPTPAASALQDAEGPAPQATPTVPFIAIAVADRARRRQLAAAAMEQGFQPLVLGAHGSLPLEGPPPGAALVDLGAGDGNLALIADLAALDPPVPSLALAPPHSLWGRVLAARVGARRLVCTEASSKEIFSAAENLLTPRRATESTVLVLAHVPAILSSVRFALHNEGIRVVGVEDPMQFWEVLERAQPDLVILESDLPMIGGAELCRVIRIDARWAGLPVLLLTASDDSATVAALYDAGADDVVASPIIGTELVGRVRNRLDRTRVHHAHGRDARGGDTPVDPAPLPTAGNAATDYDVDVVVVEDDPLLSELLSHALTTRGYRFRHFTDGQVAAGELAGSRPLLRSRVVLLDVDLPSLNGFGVLRQMAMTDNLTATRVIMLTAHSSEPEIVNALKLGAFDHVAKPFSVPVLMQRVRGALGD